MDNGNFLNVHQNRTKVATLERWQTDTLLLATAYKDLGESLLDVEEWNEAGLYLYKASLIYEKHYKNQAHDGIVVLAQTYTNLSIVFHTKGAWETEVKYLHKSIQIYQTRNATCVALAQNYASLAYSSFVQEQFDEAMMYYNKAQEIFAETSPESLDMASVHYWKAEVSLLQLNKNEARISFQNALLIQEQQAPESLDVADIYVNLAHLFHDMGDVTRGKQCCDEADRIIRQTVSLPHQRQNLLPRELSFICNNLGYFMYRCGSMMDARKHYQMAIDIGEQHAIQSAMDFLNLGQSFHDEGRNNEARLWYSKAIRTNDDNTHIQFEKRPLFMAITAFAAANALYAIGRLCHDEGDYTDALLYIQRAIEIYVRLGPKRLKTFLHMEARPLPTLQVLETKVASNPSRLVVSQGSRMIPSLWCCVFAKLLECGDRQAVYYLLRELPHLVSDVSCNGPRKIMKQSSVEECLTAT